MRATPEGYRALVVDDEHAVQAITMHSLAREGILCEAADDGAQALEMLASNSYDVVITDLCMPRKHGHSLAVEMLSWKDRPMIVVLTACEEPRLVKDLLARGIDDIQFKPLSFRSFAAKVHSMLDRKVEAVAKQTEAARGEKPASPQPLPPVSRVDLDQRLSQVVRMLPVSQAAIDVLNMTASPKWTPQAVAERIQQDPSLAVEVLRLANSSFCNPGAKKIDRVDEAVVRIGQRNIGELAFATTLLSSLSEQALPIDVSLVWQRSMAAAMAMESLLTETAWENPRGLFLSALLHPMGKLVLAKLYPREYEAMIENCRRGDDTLLVQERRMFTDTHSQILARLLESWSLPPDIYRPVKYLAEPYSVLATLPDPLRKQALLVKVAACLGKLAVGRFEPWDELDFPPLAALRELGLRGLAPLIAKTKASIDNMAASRPAMLRKDPPASDAVRREIAYCDLSQSPYDFIASVLATMNIQAAPHAVASLENDQPALFNCLGVNCDTIDHDLRRALRQPGRVVVTDAIHAKGYQGWTTVIGLPASVQTLRPACLTISRELA